MDNQYHPIPQRRMMDDGIFSFKSKIEDVGIGHHHSSSSIIIVGLPQTRNLNIKQKQTKPSKT
jgi:hypothetical protein